MTLAVEELQYYSECQSKRIRQLEEKFDNLPTNLSERLDAIWAYIDDTRERLAKVEKLLSIEPEQIEAESNQD